MTVVILTFKDSPMQTWEFVLPGESTLYRVSRMGDYAIVTIGARELFNSGTPSLRKTLMAYLRRRFQEFRIVDFSEVNIQQVYGDMKISS